MLINQEIDTYQKVSQQVSLKKVWDLMRMTPHEGQAPIVEDFDNDDEINCFVITLGRRSGKSASTSIIVLRELLIPFSNTILLSPSYKNSKVMFDEVLKHVQSLKIPIATINKAQFSIELENGSKFSSVTQTNYESALGSRVSLFVVDETQSIPDILNIYNQIIGPMLLDYGIKDNGILYAKAIFLGTPRGQGTAFHSLFLRAEHQRGWKSYQAPSTCNPLLPRAYIEQQKDILPEHVYRQEILAEWISTGSGVFFAFDPVVNLYDPEELEFDTTSNYVIGLDFGHTDSTAALLVYVDRSGTYFIHDAYQKAACPTKEHVENFKRIESVNKGQLLDRFGDPSAAQTILDLRTDYSYDVQRANNKIAPSISTINDLFAVQGYDKKPKLYINKELHELIRQIKLVTYKEGVSKNNPDPFSKDPEGTHWDLLAALRYAVYTHHRREQAGVVII